MQKSQISKSSCRVLKLNATETMCKGSVKCKNYKNFRGTPSLLRKVSEKSLKKLTKLDLICKL